MYLFIALISHNFIMTKITQLSIIDNDHNISIIVITIVLLVDYQILDTTLCLVPLCDQWIRYTRCKMHPDQIMLRAILSN
jgi:hypothetical protein